MSNIDNDTKNAFLTVCPRDGDYMQSMFQPIKLRIVRDSGVDTTPDIDIQVNDLASGRKHFQNNSGKSDSFKVDVLIKDTDIIQSTDTRTGYTVLNDKGKVVEEEYEYFWDIFNLKDNYLWVVLDYFARNLTPLNVVTRAVDVKDGMYVITDNSSRKQDYEGNTIWTLEFTKYEAINTTSFTTSSTGVTKAIKKYNAAKAKEAKDAKKKQTAKSTLTTAQKLKKCKLSNLKYSKTKKVVGCVKHLQKVLNTKIKSNLIIDGWYGDSTKKAVKKFQTNNKKYNLKTDGNVDQNTLNCLTGKCTKTTTKK